MGSSPTLNTPELQPRLSIFRLPFSIVDWLTREPPRIFVVMLVVPVCNLPSRSAPDSFV